MAIAATFYFCAVIYHYFYQMEQVGKRSFYDLINDDNLHEFDDHDTYIRSLSRYHPSRKVKRKTLWRMNEKYLGHGPQRLAEIVQGTRISKDSYDDVRMDEIGKNLGIAVEMSTDEYIWTCPFNFTVHEGKFNFQNFEDDPVKRAADEFIIRSFGKFPFYSMHWIYRESDFLPHCRDKVSAENVLACSFLLKNDIKDINYQARIVAIKMFDWMKKTFKQEAKEAERQTSLNKKMAKQLAKQKNVQNLMHVHSTSNDYEEVTAANIKAVYVASSPQDLNFVKNLTNWLEDLSKMDRTGRVTACNRQHLHEFLQRKFRTSCSIKDFNSQSNNFIDQVEQEISVSSTVFLQSKGSDYSQRVLKERFIRGKNDTRDTTNEKFFGGQVTESLLYRDKNQRKNEQILLQRLLAVKKQEVEELEKRLTHKFE